MAGSSTKVDEFTTQFLSPLGGARISTPTRPTSALRETAAVARRNAWESGQGAWHSCTVNGCSCLGPTGGFDPQESFAAEKSSRSLLQRLTRTSHAVVNDCGRRKPHRNCRCRQPTGPVIELAHSSSAPLPGCRGLRHGRQRWPRRCPPSEAPGASACFSFDQHARPPGCRSR